MDRLIPAFNKLQDIASTLNIPDGIELPQIVVVGAQSSGKSSVLESLVRKDFLPRGSGIVTRRPLVLRLCNWKEQRPPCGVFGHMPNRCFTEFDEIRSEIERATKEAAPKDKDICPDPIYLNVYSQEVLDITLVDLPGITKVPVGGQPHDIEQVVRGMIVNYIKSPNSLILAISAANTDLANSDALKLAREVDPSGERTLGVLTKLDLMDRGTNALEMLMNRVYPLRLGYIGMICRSQQDINNCLPIDEHLQKEKQYFACHEAYRGLATRMGADFLALKLNELLISHLRTKLPELKKKVSDQLREKQLELQSYGYLDESQEGKGTLLLIAIQRFCKDYEGYIDGKFFSKDSLELQGGALINKLFFTDFRKKLEELSPFAGIDDQHIQSMLANSDGLRPSFFISSKTFEMIMSDQILQFTDPSVECLGSVYHALGEVVQEKIRVAELERFTVLKIELMKVAERTLISCYESSLQMVQTLLQVEMAYTNVQHPQFIGCSAAVVAVTSEMMPAARGHPQPVKGGKPQGFEDISNPDVPATGPFRPEIGLQIIKRLMKSYFNIVRTNIGDLIPKTIVHLLVNESVKRMERELISKLFLQERFDELLEESGDVTMKRAKCIEELKTLTQLNEVLSKMNFSE